MNNEHILLNLRDTCRTFLTSFNQFKSHQQNPPIYPENDQTQINLLQAKDVIRLEAPDVQLFPPTKISYNKDTDTYTKTVIYDGKIHTYTYKLIVKNKGTDNEEVTALILPDGSQISFEGWDI